MNTPELTWRLRRIGKSLWPSLHARKARGWLNAAAAPMRRSAVDDRPPPSSHWLAALRERTS